MSRAENLRDIIEPKGLSYCAKIIATRIKEDRVVLDINSIAITGISGTIIGGVVSYLTKLPLIIVRKEENSHSIHKIEFSDDIEELNYCIVDDSIGSGSTIRNIVNKISENAMISSLKKIYLYHDVAEYNKGFDINDDDKDENLIPVFAFYNLR